MDWQWICTGMALDWHRIGRIGKGLALDLCGIGTKFVNGLAPKWCMIGIDTGLALDWRPSDTACQPLRLWNDIGLTSDWHQIGLRLSSDWHQICWIGNNLALYMQWVDTQVMRIGSPLAFDLHKSDNWHGIGARLISDWQWIDNGFRWIGIGLTLNWLWTVTGLYLYFQRINSQATLGGNPLAAHVLHWDWHWQLEIGQSKPSQSCTNPAIPPQYELSWISMDWRGLTDWWWKYRKSVKLSVKLPWHNNSKLSIGLCILCLFVFLSFCPFCLFVFLSFCLFVFLSFCLVIILIKCLNKSNSWCPKCQWVSQRQRSRVSRAARNSSRKKIKKRYILLWTDTFAVIAKSTEGDDGIHWDLDELTQRSNCAAMMRNETRPQFTERIVH